MAKKKNAAAGLLLASMKTPNVVGNVVVKAGRPGRMASPAEQMAAFAQPIPPGPKGSGRKIKGKKVKNKWKSRTYSFRDRAELLSLPKSRRNVMPKTGRGVMARWGGEWTAADVGQLVRKDQRFSRFFLSALMGKSGEHLSEFFPMGDKWGKIEDRLIARLGPRPSQYADRAAKLLAEIAAISNKAKVHPYDLAVVSLTAIGNQDSAKGQPVREQHHANAMRYDDDATTLVTYFAPLLQSMKHVTRGMGFSSSYLLRDVAKALRNMDKDRRALFSGFFAGKGLKPWRRGKGQTIGVELIGFGYVVPKTFDDKGVAVFDSKAIRLTHEMAAIRAEKFSRTDSELAAMLAMTAAGRIFLCASKDSSSMFLASSRKPNRKLFQIRGRSAKDAVLFDHPNWEMLTGFIL